MPSDTHTQPVRQEPFEMLASLPPPAPARVFDAGTGPINQAEVVGQLRERGFCILRNLFDQVSLAEFIDGTEFYLKRPAIAGAPGYWKVDHPKKMFNPFVLGGGVYDLLLDERVIDIVETVMDSECILAETMLKFDRGVDYEYFPIHCDFAAGWKKSASADLTLSLDDINQVLGIGGAIYLHDTTNGAFSYCEGTHMLIASHGQDIDRYPAAEKEMILRRLVRCDGLKGDLVLFDDRGFHGPDQPSRADRLVILIDYFRVKTFGPTQVSPFQVWTSDLGKLNEKQFRVLGAGANYMIPPAEYAHTRFRKNAFYPLLCRLVESAYMYNHVKNRIKKALRA